MRVFVRSRHVMPRYGRLFLLAGGLIVFSRPGQAQNTEWVIQSGTTVNVAGTVVLNNVDLFCNGAFDAANGTLWLTGANNTTFNGSGIPVIGSLQLNTGTGTSLSLNTGLQVSGVVNFQAGLIELNGQHLQLTGTASLQGESETSRITGTTGGAVTAFATAVNGPDQLNIGNLGAMLTSGADLGNVMITRSHVPAENPGNSTLQGIQRTFLIQPQNDASLNAILRFYYFDAELNGNDASTLTLWTSTDGVSWGNVGADIQDPTAKYVEKDGLASLSYWTLSGAANPLPLSLETFTVTCAGSYAAVQWQTGEESNLDYFLVQRSADGTHWTALGQVPATNNPTGSSYVYKDLQPPGTAFYRLQIVDQSGNSTYSPVFRGGCSEIAMPFILYPNPAESQTVAQLSVRQAVTATVLILDINGQQVYNAVWNLQPGMNQLNLPLYGLASGNYIVKVLLPNANSQQAQLLKK
jgi:Secretion system C-terminal sorting domain